MLEQAEQKGAAMGTMGGQALWVGIEPAEHHYRKALVLAEELGMRPLRAHCHRGLGTLYAQIGQRERAHAELATAMKMYQSMDMTFRLPEAEAALAQVHVR